MLRRSGIVVLPGARIVTRETFPPGFITVAYELGGGFSQSEAEQMANSIITSLKEMGWSDGSIFLRNPHGNFGPPDSS